MLNDALWIAVRVWVTLNAVLLTAATLLYFFGEETDCDFGDDDDFWGGSV
jgi:hypothetical protein